MKYAMQWPFIAALFIQPIRHIEVPDPRMSFLLMIIRKNHDKLFFSFQALCNGPSLLDFSVAVAVLNEHH